MKLPNYRGVKSTRRGFAMAILQQPEQSVGSEPASKETPLSEEKQRTPYAMRLVIDGKERYISYEELALSNNLAQEALVRLLVRKKIIKAEELLEEINTVKTERYRPEPGGQTS